jgi:hypothetical protein
VCATTARRYSVALGVPPCNVATQVWSGCCSA